uniref:EB domain-containing protein n=1 Tax=Panagrolaimus sp. ES5 TaxID=591445 RepID=A0AC34FGC5_9BILA
MCDIGYVFNGYQCIVDQAWKSIPPSSGLNCNVDEVAIYNKCYPSRRRGQQCFYNEQCVLDDGIECRGGICQDKLQSDPYPIPLGPGPVIFPPGLNCDDTEIAIYNKCYPKLRIGEFCFFDVQCVLDVGLECRNGICQIDLHSGQYPIPLGPGPVIFPPSPQNPQPRPYPPQYQPYPLQHQQPPQITVITICCLRMNSWPCCNCAINQVLINGRCYSTSLPGGSCQYDQQCNDPLARKPLYCGNGICRWVFSGNR